MSTEQSWGRFPKTNHQALPVGSRFDPLPLSACSRRNKTVLPYGLGRSYGDVCLNDDGHLLLTRPLNHFIHFDPASGCFTAEAGVSLGEVLKFSVPKGFFLPVTPGTKYVTLGGAVANDVHGKNHHCAGTFGRHVRRMEILKSSGQRLIASPTENTDEFRAAIGGLGLTGLILWVEIQLKPMTSPFIVKDEIAFGNYKEFFELARQSDSAYEYTVAWFDCLAGGNNLGRGIFMRGNHLGADEGSGSLVYRDARTLRVPFQTPGFLLNSYTLKAFNHVFYALHQRKTKPCRVNLDAFFYPLDFLDRWNLLYGKRGFFQYQCVLDIETTGLDPLRELLETSAKSNLGSFLAVMKLFGDLSSPGIMSFPRKGVTLTLDFPNKGRASLDLLDRFDEIVRAARGAVYPAKDARMSAESFRAYYPQAPEFSKTIDPRFSSSFWRRVNR